MQIADISSHVDKIKPPTAFNYDINILAQTIVVRNYLSQSFKEETSLYHNEIRQNHVYSQENIRYSNRRLTLTCCVGSSAFS